MRFPLLSHPQVVVEQPVPISVQPHTQERYQLPYTARIVSIVFVVVCSVAIWLPGIYCAVTALVLAIMVRWELAICIIHASFG